MTEFARRARARARSRSASPPRSACGSCRRCASSSPRSRCSPSAAAGRGASSSGWLMFDMDDDVKILAVSARGGLGRRRRRARRSRAGSRAARAAARASAGSPPAISPPGRRRTGPRELAEMGRVVQRDGRRARAALRRAARARRVGEPRPAHAARLDAGDARGDRGRARRAARVPAGRCAIRCARSRRLVDDLFELARIDAGVLDARAARGRRSRPLVESCVRGLRGGGASARASGSRPALDDALPPVRCAPDQVERVLLNLLTNALRHTPSDGSIAVVARPAERRVRVAVEDTGEGVDAGAATRMFDRFWRGDSRPRRPTARRRPRPRDRARPRRGAGRTHLGRGARSGGARVSFTLPVAG